MCSLAYWLSQTMKPPRRSRFTRCTRHTLLASVPGPGTLNMLSPKNAPLSATP